MRIKAIPTAVENVVSVHPIAVGLGVLALGFGVYHYRQAQNGPAPDNAAQPQFSYGMPQIMPAGGATGMIDAIVNPAASANSSTAPASTGIIGDPNGTVTNTTTGTTPSDTGILSNMDIFNFEKLKEGHDYQLATDTLAANLAIAATNAQIAMAGIQSANWQVGASLAQAFIQSGQQFSAGNIGGITYAFLGTGTPLKFDPSKYAARNASAQMQIQAQQSSFAALLNSPLVNALLGNSSVQPNSGSITTTPTAGGTTSPTLSPSGSTSLTSFVSGSSPSSSSSSTYDASAYNYGGTSGGGSDSISRQFSSDQAAFA